MFPNGNSLTQMQPDVFPEGGLEPKQGHPDTIFSIGEHRPTVWILSQGYGNRRLLGLGLQNDREGVCARCGDGCNVLPPLGPQATVPLRIGLAERLPGLPILLGNEVGCVIAVRLLCWVSVSLN